MLWTGHLAWVPIALSVAAALLATSSRRATLVAHSDTTTGPEPDAAGAPIRSALGASLLSAVLLTATAVWVAPRLPGGDEPHYLVITQSLLFDGDLRIGNNHDARQYEAYYPGTLRPDRIRDGQNGEIYSIHAPGTSVVVLPAFALLGYSGAQATIALLAAVSAGLVWLATFRLTGSQRAAWFAWTLLSTSPTFLIQGVTVFPDGPGALVTAAAALAIVTPALPPGRFVIVVLGALLATLPWLHTRFAVISILLAGLLVWRLSTEWRRSDRDWRRDTLALFAVPAVSAAGWFGYFWTIYGTFNPSAPYGTSPQARLAYVPGGLTALLFDQQFGLLAYSPAFALAALTLRPGALRGTSNQRVVAMLGMAGIYLAAVATYWMWWAGIPAPPARFATAILPILALAAAWAWFRLDGRTRMLWWTTSLIGFLSTLIALGPGRGVLAWNYRQTPRALWLDWWGSVVDLPRAWPSFFWRLTAGDVSSEAHFAMHVTMWIGCAAAVIGVVAGRRRSAAGAEPATTSSTRATWALALGIMMAAQLGWWWNGVDGLNAAASQLSLLRRVEDGRTLWHVQPGRVGPASRPVLRLRPTRADADDGSPVAWLPLPALPAGRYSVAVTTARPVGGRLSLHADGATVATFDLRPLSRQSFSLALPAPVDQLLIRPDDALRTWVRDVELEWIPDGRRP
jgi:hypothetical protein